MMKDFQKIMLIIVAAVSTFLYVFKGPAQYKGKLDQTTEQNISFKAQLDSIVALNEQIQADYKQIQNERDSLGAELFESKYYLVNLEKENKRLKGRKNTEVLLTTGVEQVAKLQKTVAKLEHQKDSLTLNTAQIKRKADEMEALKLNAEDEVKSLRQLIQALQDRPIEVGYNDEWVNLQVVEKKDSADINLEMKNQVNLDYVKIKYGFLNLRKRHAIYLSTDNPYIETQTPTTYILDRKLQRKIKSED